MDEHSDKHEAEKPPRYSFSLLSKGGVLNHILHLASSNCVPSRAYFPKRVMDCLPGDRLYVMYLLVYVQLLQSCPTLCGPMGLPVSSVRGILQARILEWVVCPPPGDLPPPGIEPVALRSTCIGRWVLYQEHHLESPCCVFINT